LADGVESLASSLLCVPCPLHAFADGVESRASSLLYVLLLLVQTSTFFSESAQGQRGPLPAFADGVESRASSLLYVLLLLVQASTFFSESAQGQRGPTHRHYIFIHIYIDVLCVVFRCSREFATVSMIEFRTQAKSLPNSLLDPSLLDRLC
jgi:hypothetical protein